MSTEEKSLGGIAFGRGDAKKMRLFCSMMRLILLITLLKINLCLLTLRSSGSIAP